MSLRKSIRHAFAVERPDEDVTPDPDASAVVDKMCRTVSRRGLTTPGLMMLELARPLNGIGAATLHVAQPTLEFVLSPDRARKMKSFASFLERRGSIDYLTRRLESMEAGDVPAPPTSAPPPAAPSDSESPAS